MNFIEFKQDFYEKILPNKPEYIREGQALMNYLDDIWLAEYKRITFLSQNREYPRNIIDCFYNDKLIPNTLKYLKEFWVNYPN
jgi:hypothetical protein